MKRTFWAMLLGAALLLPAVANAEVWTNGNVSVPTVGMGTPAVDVNGANYAIQYRWGPGVRVWVAPPPQPYWYPNRYYNGRRYGNYYYYNNDRYWGYRRGW